MVQGRSKRRAREQADRAWLGVGVGVGVGLRIGLWLGSGLGLGAREQADTASRL